MSPRRMMKIWAAVEHRSSPGPVTVLGQEQSETPNPRQRKRDGDSGGVNVPAFMREEATPMSSASSHDPSSQTSIMGGDTGVEYETDTGASIIDDATREKRQEEKEGQQQHHNGNLRGNHFSRRWLTIGKHCNIIPWPLNCPRKFNWLRISKMILVILAVAVAVRYMIIQYKFAILSCNNISATPPSPLDKTRRNLNLQLALSQIINPSTHYQIFYSLNVSTHQQSPNITLAALAAFTASCHPHAFTLVTFLSHNLSGAFEAKDPSFPPQQARAALFHAHELAVRAARAETKADTGARRIKQEDKECHRLIPSSTDKFDDKGMKRHHPRCRTRNGASQSSSSPLLTSTQTTHSGQLLDQDTMVIPQVEMAFENQTLYRHLISSPSSLYSSEKKEAALHHLCEELTDAHHAHTYLVQVVHILEELYMTAAAAAAAVSTEERWAREVRDGFDEWFYNRLFRASSFCRGW